MRAGPLRIAAVVLLSFSLGLHWAALQSVAWATMLITRVQSTSVAEAVRTTFDGEHPCALCHAVREGRASERGSPESPVPAKGAAVKLDLALASGPAVLWVEETSELPGGSRCSPPRFRSEPPSLPPPRRA